MIGVLDTSAVVRLFIPDGPIPTGLEAFVRKAERGENVVIAPELILAEVGNVLNRKRKDKLLTMEECHQLLADCLALPIRLYSHREILPSAMEIAAENNLTVYDSIFLALAQRHEACFFTADKRLGNVAALIGL